MGKTACLLVLCAAVVVGCTSGASGPRGTSGTSGTRAVTGASATGGGLAQSAACSYTSNSAIGYSATPPAGFQTVLRKIMVMPASPQPATSAGQGSWAYFSKTAVLIRAGTGPVLVSVPSSWRGRAAITWGSAGQVESLTLTACAQPAGVWDVFAGGLYLRTNKGCVPVQFRLGGRTVTVTYGVGRDCR
jgi:hypothetical protein